MSIVALKRKTAAKYNNSSVNVPQFSINGGYRNQGWVGQTSLSRSLIKTPHRGATPRGHGGCCGTYNVSVVCPREPCTNNNAVIKKSVVSTDGMLDEKFRWLRRPVEDSQGNSTGFSVKPDVNHNLNQQGEYISRVSKKTISDIKNNCPPVSKPSCDIGCDMYKNRFTSRAGIDNFAKQRGPLTATEYTDKVGAKQLGPLSSSEYLENINDECVSIDINFQKKLNTKPSSTPFGC